MSSTERAIAIWINGERADAAPSMTAKALLERSGYTLRYAAVVINDTVVAREKLHDHPLQEGDRIEVLMPFAGG